MMFILSLSISFSSVTSKQHRLCDFLCSPFFAVVFVSYIACVCMGMADLLLYHLVLNKNTGFFHKGGGGGEDKAGLFIVCRSCDLRNSQDQEPYAIV